jgi:hypothetical protein
MNDLYWKNDKTQVTLWHENKIVLQLDWQADKSKWLINRRGLMTYHVRSLGGRSITTKNLQRYSTRIMDAARKLIDYRET